MKRDCEGGLLSTTKSAVDTRATKVKASTTRGVVKRVDLDADAAKDCGAAAVYHWQCLRRGCPQHDGELRLAMARIFGPLVEKIEISA